MQKKSALKITKCRNTYNQSANKISLKKRTTKTHEFSKHRILKNLAPMNKSFSQKHKLRNLESKSKRRSQTINANLEIKPERLKKYKVYHLFATCPIGLESILKSEIRNLPFVSHKYRVRRRSKQIHFAVEKYKYLEMVKNYLQTAQNVYLQLGRSVVTSSQRLKTFLKSIFWSDVLKNGGLVPEVKVKSKCSKLDNTRDITSILYKIVYRCMKTNNKQFRQTSFFDFENVQKEVDKYSSKELIEKLKESGKSYSGNLEKLKKIYKRYLINTNKNKIVTDNAKNLNLYSITKKNSKNGLFDVPKKFIDDRNSIYCEIQYDYVSVSIKISNSTVRNTPVNTKGGNEYELKNSDIVKSFVYATFLNKLKIKKIWDPFCFSGDLLKIIALRYYTDIKLKKPDFEKLTDIAELEKIEYIGTSTFLEPAKTTYKNLLKESPSLEKIFSASFISSPKKKDLRTVSTSIPEDEETAIVTIFPIFSKNSFEVARNLSHVILDRPDLANVFVLTKSENFQRHTLLQWDTLAITSDNGEAVWLLRLNRQRSAIVRRHLRKLKKTKDRDHRAEILKEVEELKRAGDEIKIN